MHVQHSFEFAWLKFDLLCNQKSDLVHGMHDAKLAKGKAREETHWQLGWWELLPLIDGPSRYVSYIGRQDMPDLEISSDLWLGPSHP